MKDRFLIESGDREQHNWEQTHASALQLLRAAKVGEPFMVAVPSPDSPSGLHIAIQGGAEFSRLIELTAREATDILPLKDVA